MTIYSDYDSRTIDVLIKDWDTSKPEKAPFIKIGKLLLALDQTGVDAWQALIKTLMTKYKANNIMLYSGRHGALEGCFTENGQVPYNTAEIDFYDEDVLEARALSRRLSVNIQVVDTGSFTKDSYRSRVLNDIKTNWIIVSWCHSISSMRNLTALTPAETMDFRKDGVRGKLAQSMKIRTIFDVVTEYYHWVPKTPEFIP